jgi:hypothetical protein
VLEHVGEIAGMKGVAVVDGGSLSFLERAAKQRTPVFRQKAGKNQRR